MDQPDQQTIAWIVGGIIGGVGAVVAAVKRTKVRLSTGSKVDDVSAKLDNFVQIVQSNNEELHTLTRATLRETARAIDESTRTLIKVEAKVDEHGRKLDDHSNRIIRLEDRVPHGTR